jgi:hypothetical protein
MALQTGFPTLVGRILYRGTPPIVIPKNAGTIANLYPGRLAIREDTDYDVKVGDGVAAPIGWVGYETGSDLVPETIDTIWTLDREVPIIKGGGFVIRGKLAAGTVAVEGDLLFSWSNGRVVPGIMLNGVPAIKVPFVQNATVKDTLIDIPGGVQINDVVVQVVTAVAASSIDVGFLNSGESGDEDGLLDGESGVVLGFVPHNMIDATRTSITLGDLLEESEGKDAFALYYAIKKAYLTDGTIKSLTYTTSAHAITGNFYVAITSPGVQLVGRAGMGVSAASADADIPVESIL